MTASSEKPLPALPGSPGNSLPLAAEARTHRSKFIRHILAEDDRSLDTQRDVWAGVLEAALDELGENISRGDWLFSIKRGREWMKSQRDTIQLLKKAEVDHGGTVSTDGKKKREANAMDDKRSCQHDSTRSARSRGSTDHPLALTQLRLLLSKHTQHSPESHLLLSVAAFESKSSLPNEDSGPTNPTCVFRAGTFTLPNHKTDETGGDGVVLFGVDEWDGETFASHEDAIGLVGGTFYFKGIDSLAHYDMLFKVLRLAIYVHLSLLLEQHFLANSNVERHSPALDSSPETMPSSLPLPVEIPPASPRSKPKNRHSVVTSGILSLISKTGSLVHRAASMRPVKRRAHNIVPASTHGPQQGTTQVGERLRLSSGRPSLARRKPEGSFSTALKRIEQSVDFLSASPGVSFDPPSLLVSLAEKEKEEVSRSLKGDEKAGLTTILGWDNTWGVGMSGIPGFVQHQQFSVLYSQLVPSPPPSTSATSSISSSPSSHPPAPMFTSCIVPRWLTYRYYRRIAGPDSALGEVIVDLCSNAGQSCDTTGCEFRVGQHERRFIHGGLKVTMKISPFQDEESEDSDDLRLWQSCQICSAKTSRSPMSDGTYLFSFGKFLEALIYSPAICVLAPPLCEHTTPPPRPWPPSDLPLPQSRLNIIRHFSYSSSIVSFSLSVIENIFELRVPRLQIIRAGARDNTSEASRLQTRDQSFSTKNSEEKRVLRREIVSWWQSVADHIDTLEESFKGDDLVFGKALPRLPSIYDDLDFDETGFSPPVPAADHCPPIPPATYPPFYGDMHKEPESEGKNPSMSSPVIAPRKETDPAHLLSNLRHKFQSTEQALYAQLARTQLSSLNDVRWSFRAAARGAVKRLSAWEHKHLSGKGKSRVIGEKLATKEPEWWGSGCHAVPGANVIVQEGDWGSIIAFTLSSGDYQGELASMSLAQPHSIISQSQPPASPSPAFSNPLSVSITTNSYNLFNLAAQAQPDPDQDDIWQEYEPFTAVISRKQHPRDSASLLSLRDVLRHRPTATGSSGPPSSLIGTLSSTSSSNTENQPAAAGEASGLPETEFVGNILQHMEAALADTDSVASSSASVHAHIRRGEASIISTESEVTVGPNEDTPHVTRPPTPPSKDDHDSGVTRNPQQQGSSAQSSAAPSSFTTSLTNGLTTAMRFVFNASDKTSQPAPPSVHNGPLTAHPQIDERPHVKYDWTIGRRLKFSCTVYFAKQFDTLRRQCGVDDVFVQSLVRSTNWAAEGGKSKSNFWKTSDNRFIIKTLVNAWNVADLQVLVDLAPSYFRYMDDTASKPTVLAKLLGFYTVEIRNLESGTVQAKADLLVMENLFYQREIVKTFDLKGIPGRKVKANPHVEHKSTNKTLFDGEWIEGQQRTLMLVRPHSKVVMREAIESDSDFLSNSNIMDYSLLLGVDEEQKQIICGLVDTIGSYTFAKTLEYKAKQGLHSAKNVTVVPPAEYRERFVKALDRYFLACPDKWSRPLDKSDSISDPNLLPSVL